MKTSRLSRLASSHGEWLEDKAEMSWVYHVRTPHLLTQAAGYLKYVHGHAAATGVFYRGQEQLYSCSLQPSLYRGVRMARGRNKRNELINAYVAECGRKGRALKSVPAFAWEPLLQHYGIKTKWIDLVDNAWVALWFACHTAHSTGRQGEYLHFEQRRPSPNTYAYIVLIEVGLEQDRSTPGYFSGKDTELVDLRIAVPSTFLRPHAQHALLAKAKISAASPCVDYRDMIAGVLRVDLDDALKWLGEGTLLTPHALFPPPVYDFGYRDLLGDAPIPPRDLGAIQHIGA